jgi:Xaa-Pro aminopeptidase
MPNKIEFSRDFFVRNRQSLVDSTNAGLIVLAANGLLQRSADTTFPFRQDSNFWYLTGVNEPDFYLVISESSTFLIAPKRSDHRDQWDGLVDKKILTSQSGIAEIEEYHAGWTRLDLLLKKYKKVHTIAPVEAYYDSFGFYANPARGHLHDLLSKHRNLDIVDIRKPLARLRQIKQPSELAALQSAIDITASTLKRVKKNLATYANEAELSAIIGYEFLRRGADGHAYQPIVASGRNATTIHYIDNNNLLLKNQLVLLDVGAEVHNYSADITRTYALSKPNKRQQAVHDAVMRVHQAALDMLQPGVLMRQYEAEVDKLMAHELQKLGLIDDITNKKKLKKYYPHLTSHFLGLDTHDAADYDQPLVPNMVVTVEPGIYIKDENIGIRIEDDVLITETGVKVLSGTLPTHL